MVRLEAVRAQEVVFAICMGLVAFLGRENPAMDYPAILWAFGAFLSFNLGYHLLLRRREVRELASLVSVAVNSVLVSAVLWYSGGGQSYFWPLYLLPIFTACLHLERRQVLVTFAFAIGFLAYFHMEQFWAAGLMGGVELFIKLAVLAFSAGVTFRVSQDERSARASLERSREELDGMTRSLSDTEERIFRRQNVYNLGQLAGGALHDLNNPLTIILGSAELMLREVGENSSLREDIERISLAARHCARITANLLGWSRFSRRRAAGSDVGGLLSEMLELFDYHVKTKNLDVVRELSEGLPALEADSGPAVQALLTLMIKVMGEAEPGGRLRIAAAPSGQGGLALKLVCPLSSAEASAEDLRSCREMFGRAGGALEARTVAGRLEYSAYLPIGAGLARTSS